MPNQYPAGSNIQLQYDDQGVASVNPGFLYQGQENNALAYEQREINGVFYTAQNASWSKFAQIWSQVDVSKPSYATAIYTDGTLHYLSSPPGTTPFAWIDDGPPPLPPNANLSGIGVFNVKAYGAKGDGITDDTTAINNAIIAANAAGGGDVYCLNATYLVGQRTLLGGAVYACIVMLPNVRLIGQSRTGTIIKLANNVQACVVGGYTGCDDATVENITLDGNRTNQTESNQDGNQCGLFLYVSSRTKVSHVTTQNCQRQGYYDSIISYSRVDDFYAINCGAEGFSCSNSYYGCYTNIIVESCGVNAPNTDNYHSGIYINGGNIECSFVNMYAAYNGGFGFSLNSDNALTDCVNNVFVGVTVTRNYAGSYFGYGSLSQFVARNRFYNFCSRLDGVAAGTPALWLNQCNDTVFHGLIVYNSISGAGIRLTKSSRNRFEDMITYDDQGTHTQTYGIQEDQDSVNCVENIFIRPVFNGGFTVAPYTLYNSVVQGAVGAANFLRPVTPTLLNSWVTYSGLTPRYEKDADGFVHIHGAVSTGTIGSPAFVLPVGFRPPNDLYLAVTSNSTFGELYISSSTGNVTPNVGSNAWFSLEAATFLGT